MPTTKTLSVDIQTFPVGTSVSAYKQTNWPSGNRNTVPVGAPKGSSDATASVGSDGSLAFTGLTDSTQYTAVAQVSSVYRYVDFDTYATSHEMVQGDTAGGRLSGTFPNPGLVNAPRVFNVKEDYGALGTGSNEPATPFQNAYNAANTIYGGTVWIPEGTYQVSDLGTAAVVALAPDNARTKGKVTFAGPGVLKLTSATPRAIDFGKLADHDVFRNVECRGLTVDSNSIGGSHHVLIGTLQNGSFQTRISVEGVHLVDCKTLNVAADSNNTADRRNVAIVVRHTADNEATQDTLKDILVLRCEFNGGAYGAEVAATSPGAATNVFYDRIRFVSSYHDTGVTYTANHGGANFFIGSGGIGGMAMIYDCDGKHSGDVGIELDTPQNGWIVGNRITDSIGVMIFWRNFNTPTDLAAQNFWVLNNTSEVVDLTPSNLTYPANGYRISHTTQPVTIGTTIFVGNKFHSNSTEFSGGEQAFHGRGSPFSKLFVRDFEIVIDKINFAPVANKVPSIVHVWSSVDNSLIDVQNVHVHLAGDVRGTNNVTAGNNGWIAFGPPGAGLTSQLYVDRIYVNDQLSDSTAQGGVGSGRVYVNIGGGQSGTLKGGIHRIKVPQTPATNSGTALTIDGSATLTLSGFESTDHDFTALGSSQSDIGFNGTSNRANVYDRRIKYRVWPKAVGAPTVPAANTAQRYTDGPPATFVWSAGTVTDLEISQDNVTFYKVFSQTAGAVAFAHRIEQGDYYRWQGTVAPTINAKYER